ncbi:MAG: hypothetical protein ACQUHE_07765 [Bacteroidia bacterium]
MMQVSDSFAIGFFLMVLLFVGKSVYDLINSKHLTSREKTNMAFIISLVPIIGSILFYSYQSAVYRNNRARKVNFK